MHRVLQQKAAERHAQEPRILLAREQEPREQHAVRRLVRTRRLQQVVEEPATLRVLPAQVQEPRQPPRAKHTLALNLRAGELAGHELCEPWAHLKERPQGVTQEAFTEGRFGRALGARVQGRPSPDHDARAVLHRAQGEVGFSPTTGGEPVQNLDRVLRLDEHGLQRLGERGGVARMKRAVRLQEEVPEGSLDRAAFHPRKRDPLQRGAALRHERGGEDLTRDQGRLPRRDLLWVHDQPEEEPHRAERGDGAQGLGSFGDRVRFFHGGPLFRRSSEQRRDHAALRGSQASWGCRETTSVRYALAHMTQEEKKRLTDYADCAG